MRKGPAGKLNIAGPVVRKLRKRNDWTQKEFAKLLREAGWKRCTRGWVSRLESGEVTLRDVDLPFLQAVLGDEFTVNFIALVAREAEVRCAERSAQRDVVPPIASDLSR